ncbi:hypothetical protein HD806DRAFT_530036 [Xylariaceae sp. AK1471]|nr:hypothetical protein HD806DRAFT_530036 [Xylariaceae sp. AK1471]
MADNIADSIAKAPVANTDDKAPETADSLPPITKEPAATADASMVPSIPAGSTTIDAPAAPSSDAAAKPEVPAAGTVQGDLTKKISEADDLALQPEKPSDSVITETVASGAPALPNGEAVKPPKPVSVEEIRDEDLPSAKPLESEKPAEDAPQADAPAPVAMTGVETAELSAGSSTSTKNGDGATGDKRKAEVTEDVAKANGGSTRDDGGGPPEKKQKTNGSATNSAGRKPGRPRKEKQKATVAVGRTARKTRSQGAPDQV